MRAFFYGRISTDRNHTELGVDRQLDLGRRMCAERGYDLAEDDIHIDNDTPAHKPRPRYEAMLKKLGPDTVIVCVDQDRLLRSVAEIVRVIGLCEKSGALILLHSGEIDTTTADGILKAHILAAVAENETRKKKERQHREREQSAKAGKVHGGPRPFGYEADGVTLRAKEAAAYRELFERVIAGDGLARIARDFEARGIMAPRSERGFCTRSLKKLLEAPRAIGMRQHRGVVIREGNWPAIVTAEVQQRALAAIAGRRPLRSATAPLRPAQLLSSLAICSECQQTMRLGWNHQKRRYLCDRSHAGCCGKVTIAADSLEPEVEKQFLALLTEPETLAAINRLKVERPDVRDLLDAVELLTDELEGYRNDAKNGEISRTDYLVIRKGVQQRLDVANAALADATNIPAMLTISPQNTIDRWCEFELDEKRRRLGAFLECVIVRPLSPGESRRDFSPERVRPLWRI